MNGALPHPVHTAQYVHLRVKVPHNVSRAAPQRINLYLFYIVGIFLHNIPSFFCKYSDFRHKLYNFAPFFKNK